MVRFQIIAQVDEVIARVVGRVNHVGMLHQREEGQARGLGHVDPVGAIRQELPIQRHGEHHCAHALELPELGQVC